MIIDDQKFREPNYNHNLQKPLDRENIEIVTKIIDSLGWLDEDAIGHDANLALFVTLQHADKLSTMEKYLPILKNAAREGKAKMDQYAYLKDRVELLNNRPQIYGTQYNVHVDGSVSIKNLKDSLNVNERRKEVGLMPLEKYIDLISQDLK